MLETAGVFNKFAHAFERLKKPEPITASGWEEFQDLVKRYDAKKIDITCKGLRKDFPSTVQYYMEIDVPKKNNNSGKELFWEYFPNDSCLSAGFNGVTSIFMGDVYSFFDYGITSVATAVLIADKLSSDSQELKIDIFTKNPNHLRQRLSDSQKLYCGNYVEAAGLKPFSLPFS